MEAIRVAALDIGNKTSGIVVADVSKHSITIRAMEVTENKEELNDYIDKTVNPLMLEVQDKKRVVLLEQVIHFSGRGRKTRNWALLNMSRTIKKNFEKAGFEVVTLQPSQKKGVGGIHKNRKQVSDEVAREFLLSDTEYKNWLSVFDGLERSHDVADAINSIRYYQDEMMP